MNKCKGYSKMWFMVLLLVAFVAGCADNAKEIPKIADTTAPTVSVTSPTNTAVAVPINRKVSVGFSEEMDPATITTATFTLKQGTTPVSGTVTFVGTTATFTPASNLTNSVLCTAMITTGAKDLAGNALASNFIFTFTTGVAADTTAPTVSVTSPTNAAVAVPINRKVNIGFSEAMDPATITTATFTVAGPGTTSVAGTVASVGTSATFTPASNLAASTLYTATITTVVKDLAGNPLASDFVFTFTTGAAADTIAPTVSVTSPTNTAVAVPFNRKVTVGFSEAMDPLTLTAATFKLTGPGLTPVTGTVSHISTTATFTPLSNLAANTIFTCTITTGVKDLAGNAMASNFVFTFTTSASPDTTAPSVIATVNANGATGVPVNTAVGATFSEPMDPLTLTSATFSFTTGGTSVPGTVTNSAENVVFTPTSNLAFSTLYTATITTGVKDLAGNAMAVNYTWSWTTGVAPDTAAPTVILVNPADLATAVAVNSSVNATFSEAMTPLTISTASFTLQASGPPLGPILTGTVAYNALTKIATFTPSSNLAFSTLYTATVTTEATDLAGNALAVNKVWSFTTAAAPVVLPAVNLLSVAPLGAAGGAGVTSCGNTLINGDISTTSASTLITGLTDGNGLGNAYTIAGCPGIVNGKIYTAPPAPGDAASMAIATQAQIDAQIAFDATSTASMPGGIVQAAELGALTLAPGVYTSGTSFSVTLVDLTLDGGGNANAFWVFQSPTTIFVGANRKVILTNGAQAKNVFWHVGSAATILAGAEMKGTILAFSGVSMGTGATLDGRAISLVGGPVTLLSNIINVPAP